MNEGRTLQAGATEPRKGNRSSIRQACRIRRRYLPRTDIPETWPGARLGNPFKALAIAPSASLSTIEVASMIDFVVVAATPVRMLCPRSRRGRPGRGRRERLQRFLRCLACELSGGGDSRRYRNGWPAGLPGAGPQREPCPPPFRPPTHWRRSPPKPVPEPRLMQRPGHQGTHRTHGPQQSGAGRKGGRQNPGW